MEEHKSQELEEASRVQFRAPFLEPESEAVHADEAAEAGSGNAKGKLLRNMSRMLMEDATSRACWTPGAVKKRPL